MSRITRLTESDLNRIVRRIIREGEEGSAPLGIKLITPQGLGTDLKLQDDGDGHWAYNGNICEFFQVARQGKGQDVYKTQLQVTNMSKKGIRIVSADIRSMDLDLYPQVTQKLLGPGQKQSFTLEITPASLDDDSVMFDIVYKTEGYSEKRHLVIFELMNNIDQCAV